MVKVAPQAEQKREDGSSCLPHWVQYMAGFSGTILFCHKEIRVAGVVRSGNEPRRRMLSDRKKTTIAINYASAD